MSSPNFQIIYPDSFQEAKLAKSYLRKMELAYGIYADSVRYNYGLSKKFPMVLHTFNSQSNGLTVWAPRQIDFYATPSLDFISTEPWDISLTTHEGRHAWQIAHFNRGFFKVLYWLFGDQVIGGASGIYPSKWFLEGDAVVAETQMTEGGRGRNGFFLNNTLKAIIPDNASGGSASSDNYFYGKNRSWDRWRFGSVKAFSPSAYDVGYMINSMARYRSKDADLAHKILNYESSHFLNFNVVASAFKKHSGYTHREYVKDSLLQQYYRLNTNSRMAVLLDSVRSIISASGVNPSESLITNPISRTGVKQGYYSEYKHLKAVGKDSVVALVQGYATPGYFVLISLDSTSKSSSPAWKETLIRPFNYDFDPSSYYDGKIYWSEYTTDPRWSQHSVFSICYIDYKTGEVAEYPGSEYERIPQMVEIEGRPMLFTVRYVNSSDGNAAMHSFIHSIDAKSYGADSLKYPRFSAEGQIVTYAISKYKPTRQVDSIEMSEYEAYYALLDDRGVSIVRGRYGLDKGTPIEYREEILPPSFHTIKNLKKYKGELFFLTDMFGASTLCRMNIETKKIRLASASIGISGYSFAKDGSLFIVKSVGDRGKFPFKEVLADIEVSPDMEFSYPLATELANQYQEKYGKALADYALKLENVEKASADIFSDKEYSKGANLFKIHSWAPVYAEYTGETSGDYDSFYEEASPGLSLYSQNTLGTMRAMFGYAYNDKKGGLGKSKNLHSAHATINWSGWYPVIEGSAHFNDKVMYKKGRYSFRSSLSAYIPLTWEADGWVRGITPALSWSFKNNQLVTEGTDLIQVNRHQANLSLAIYKTQSVAKAQVYPRWGIGGRVAASLSPEGAPYFGSLFSAYVYGYTPGLALNQGLRLSVAFQRQMADKRKYWLDNHLDTPRGFTEDMYGRNMFRATADYAIPLYLGDISIGPIAYLQQLQIIPFVDYSRIDFLRPYGGGAMGFYTGSHYQWEDRYSFGGDIMLKGHFFRIGFPMYIGVRYARTNKPCDLGNATLSPIKTYNGKGARNYCTLLLGISLY